MFLDKLKKSLPVPVKDYIKYLYWLPRIIGKPKIFCISMQRNGTTSVGVFLKEHGYRVASYSVHRKSWSRLWLKGDYERIFGSCTFKSYHAYEDYPRWFPDFYRVLNCRFPNAKFILLYRDSNKWFDSMLNHKLIKQTANDYLHSKIYRNLDSYYDKNAKNSDYIPEVDDSIDHMPLEDKRDHYIKVYEEYNREVIEYFKKYAPEKLFITSLSDNNKWLDIGGFLGIKVNVDYECHANKTIGGPNS